MEWQYCVHMGRSYGNWNGNTVFIWGGAMVTGMATLCSHGEELC